MVYWLFKIALSLVHIIILFIMEIILEVFLVDSVPDEEEELAGTNPKEPDGDGIEDGDVFQGQSLEQPGELAIESAAVSQLGSREQSALLWESLRQLAQDGAFTRLKALSDITLERLDGRGIKGDHQFLSRAGIPGAAVNKDRPRPLTFLSYIKPRPLTSLRRLKRKSSSATGSARAVSRKR